MQQSFTRPLSTTEHALYLHDRANPLHFALTAQVKGEIQPQSLTLALTQLQDRHPLLRVRIAVDRTGYAFVEQPNPIPLRMVSRQGTDDWEKELEHELRQPFTQIDAPLIRVVWLHSLDISELIIVCHHAIADGLSVVNLLRDLLTALGNPDQCLPSLPMPMPLEALLPNYQPQPMRIWQTLILKVGLWIKKLTVKPQRNYPYLRSGVLSPSLTTTLIQRCRAEKTTVHATLCAAFLLAIAHNHPQKSTLKSFSPISLRPFLTSPIDNDCGLYISGATTTHTLTPDITFWEVARSVKSQLLSKTTIENFRDNALEYARFMAVKPSPEIFLQVFRKYCDSDLMVTNLGCLDLSQQFGKLQLSAVYGPAVMSGFENERVLGVATLGNQLFFTFVYSLASPEIPYLPEQAIKILETALGLTMPGF